MRVYLARLLLRFLAWNCGDGGRYDVWEGK